MSSNCLHNIYARPLNVADESMKGKEKLSYYPLMLIINCYNNFITIFAAQKLFDVTIFSPNRCQFMTSNNP